MNLLTGCIALAIAVILLTIFVVILGLYLIGQLAGLKLRCRILESRIRILDKENIHNRDMLEEARGLLKDGFNLMERSQTGPKTGMKN